MLKYRLVLPKLAGSSISLSATVVASGGVQGWNAPRRGGRREEVYFIYPTEGKGLCLHSGY